MDLPPAVRSSSACIPSWRAAAWLLTACVLPSLSLPAQEAISHSMQDLKGLSLDELLNTKVITASRILEEWKTVPTAISVLTQDEIHRSGATRLAEALRNATGLNVERYVGSSYAISARGFNSSSSNKMQVMMDGRSLFTPLFSGVFWEVQDTLLEDIDRIEVIRGPGAALWGANAVNGVINIVSKNARDTQGALVTAAFGGEEKAVGGLRYGGKAGDSTYYRAYFKYQKRDDQILSSGAPDLDGMEQSQGGFRLDSARRGGNDFTVQGDIYLDRFGIAGRQDSVNDGSNLLGRWQHAFSADSDLQVQAYFDRGFRDVPLQFREERETYDVDVQQHFKIGSMHDVVLGGNYRTSRDTTEDRGRTFIFSPPARTLTLTSAFLQDQIALQPDRLTLTLGTKLEHNFYTGTEVQPSARVAFVPDAQHTLWAGISRAVRAPTRSDTDVRFVPNPATGFVVIKGNPDFQSENVIAYEAGYRVQPHRQWFVDVAAFYNSYAHLRTLEPTAPLGFPLVVRNERDGSTHGAEVALTFQATPYWQLSASYSYLRENLRFRPDSRDTTGGSLEGNDPRHLGRLISGLRLPGNINIDATLRYSARLPNPKLPSYTVLDLRVAWEPQAQWELAVVGQNLLDRHHPEYAGGAGQTEVQRGAYAQVTWRY